MDRSWLRRWLVGVAGAAVVGVAVCTPAPAQAWWGRGGYGWGVYGRSYPPGPGYGWPMRYGWATRYGWPTQFGWPARYSWGGAGRWPGPIWGGPAPVTHVVAPYRYLPPPVRPPKHNVAYATHAGPAVHLPVARTTEPAGTSPPAPPLGSYYPPGD